jgi:hydroxymethylglutaryl-CoA lyase
MLESLPDRVKIMEVGPRDGLQNESTVVPTAEKLAFIDALFDAGHERVEVTAFVHPRWIPPLADHAEVATSIEVREGRVCAALVPNMRGYENAAKTRVNEVAFVLAATDGHNQKNINATTDEALARYVEVADRAKEDGLPFRAYVSCAFGCPYDGEVPVSQVVAVAEKLNALGPYELSIGDTIGVGNPRRTVELARALGDAVGLDKIALHLHDTRGTALANALAGLEAGIRSFDTSAGGLGGCPYAPGASGNLATEDLVYMLDEMGVETGVDLDKLVEASLKMEKLLGRRLPSRLLGQRRAVREAA